MDFKTDEKMLKRSIHFHWEKYQIEYKLDATDRTYLIFENLNRLFEENPSLALVIYDTLYKLNAEIGNSVLAEHIHHKKMEYEKNHMMNNSY